MAYHIGTGTGTDPGAQPEAAEMAMPVLVNLGTVWTAAANFSSLYFEGVQLQLEASRVKI